MDPTDPVPGDAAPAVTTVVPWPRRRVRACRTPGFGFGCLTATDEATAIKFVPRSDDVVALPR